MVTRRRRIRTTNEHGHAQMDLLPFLARPPAETNVLREDALQQVADHAEEHKPGFHELARVFVIWFLHRYGPTSAEQLTDACKQAGIRPHDDRAFGPVYMTLARQERIVKVGAVRRERGHGTAGGNIWALLPADVKTAAGTALAGGTRGDRRDP